MASLKQLEANRNNGRLSHGPTTEIGKAESAQNSFKTGLYAKALIIRGERQEISTPSTPNITNATNPKASKSATCLIASSASLGSSAAMT